MQTKRRTGSPNWIDPDDAPPLTGEMLDQAETFDGNAFVRRGRGRPKLEVTKEQVSIRLDPDVLAKLRQSGPGWQSKINDILRKNLGLSALSQHENEMYQVFDNFLAEKSWSTISTHDINRFYHALGKVLQDKTFSPHDMRDYIRMKVGLSSEHHPYNYAIKHYVDCAWAAVERQKNYEG